MTDTAVRIPDVSPLMEGDPPDLESLAQRVTEVQYFGTRGKPRHQ